MFICFLDVSFEGFIFYFHIDSLDKVYLLNDLVCVRLAGAGVAHAHGETEDEARGGSAGSGTGLRPCSGGLRDAHMRAHTHK